MPYVWRVKIEEGTWVPFTDINDLAAKKEYTVEAEVRKAKLAHVMKNLDISESEARKGSFLFTAHDVTVWVRLDLEGPNGGVFVARMADLKERSFQTVKLKLHDQVHAHFSTPSIQLLTYYSMHQLRTGPAAEPEHIEHEVPPVPKPAVNAGAPAEQLDLQQRCTDLEDKVQKVFPAYQFL